MVRDREIKSNRHITEGYQIELTPIINGYKIITETPVYYRVPSTPLREELGLQMAT